MTDQDVSDQCLREAPWIILFAVVGLIVLIGVMVIV